jgi:hypothetical protein
LHFGFGGGGFFLKKERVFFFRGSALQVFGQLAVRNANALCAKNGGGSRGGNFLRALIQIKHQMDKIL